MNPVKPPLSLTRRDLLTHTIELSAAGVVLAWGFGIMGARETQACWVPQPPGALSATHDMARFLAACSRCGQCVTACPYKTLRLASPNDPAPTGTPFFMPRETPCYLCHDMPCVKACPTGALDPALEKIEDARMGVALVDPASCLSFQGLRCEVCYRECPESDKAIVLDPLSRGLSKHAMLRPVIKPEKCTGCGICEKVCPTDKAAIRIVDRESALGQIGAHYRLGWLADDDPKNQRNEAPGSIKTPNEESSQNALESLKNMEALR